MFAALNFFLTKKGGPPVVFVANGSQPITTGTQTL